MFITFTTQPDRKLLGAALRRAFRPVLIFCWAVAALMLLVALLGLIGGDRAAVVIFGAAAAAVVIALIAWAADGRTVTVNWKLCGLPIAWTVSDEGVSTAAKGVFFRRQRRVLVGCLGAGLWECRTRRPH